ncbi:MAG: hypothetical protein ACRD2G_02215 [Terriglobia bacterium]
MDSLNLNVIPKDNPEEMDKLRAAGVGRHRQSVVSIPFTKAEIGELTRLLEAVAIDDKCYSRVAEAVILREKISKRYFAAR